MGLLNLFIKKKKELDLLELQKIVVVDSPNRIIMSEKQLLQSAERMAQRDLEIIQDCIRILGETKKPDTFFSRFDLLVDTADRLRKFEKYLSFSESPSAAYAEVWENRQECTGQFLVRYFSDVQYQAENLKTDKGKLNKYKKFYDSLQPYYDQMDADNIDYIETRYRAYTNRLNA